MENLSAYMSQLGVLQRRALSSPESNSSRELESVVSSTQVLNAQIRDQVKLLAGDVQKTPASDPNHNIKSKQLLLLRNSFERDLDRYQRDEASYRRQYREDVARQYRCHVKDA